MRIISGRARGLKLSAPAGLDTRPTLDRVKEALFSILTPQMGARCVLDLFAGSGALGLEALSRGCTRCVFVDSAPSALSILKKNIAAARMDDAAAVVSSDALAFLRRTREVFDLVFLDPPYQSELYAAVLELLSRRNLLTDDAVVAVEWDSALAPPTIPPTFSTMTTRRYGRVCLTILRQSQGE